MMNDKYLFAPVHEFGLPCEADGCEGILRNHINLNDNVSFHRCFACEREFDRAPFTDRVKQLDKILISILDEEKS